MTVINKLKYIIGIILGSSVNIYCGEQESARVKVTGEEWIHISEHLFENGGLIAGDVGICFKEDSEKFNLNPELLEGKRFVIFYKDHKPALIKARLAYKYQDNQKAEMERLCIFTKALREAIGEDIVLDQDFLPFLFSHIEKVPRFKFHQEIFRLNPYAELLGESPNSLFSKKFPCDFLNVVPPRIEKSDNPIRPEDLSGIFGNAIVYAGEMYNYRCIAQGNGLPKRIIELLGNPALNPEDAIDFPVRGCCDVSAQGRWQLLRVPVEAMLTTKADLAITTQFTREQLNELDQAYQRRDFSYYFSPENILFGLCNTAKLLPSQTHDVLQEMRRLHFGL